MNFGKEINWNLEKNIPKQVFVTITDIHVGGAAGKT